MSVSPAIRLTDREHQNPGPGETFVDANGVHRVSVGQAVQDHLMHKSAPDLALSAAAARADGVDVDASELQRGIDDVHDAALEADADALDRDLAQISDRSPEAPASDPPPALPLPEGKDSPPMKMLLLTVRCENIRNDYKAHTPGAVLKGRLTYPKFVNVNDITSISPIFHDEQDGDDELELRLHGEHNGAEKLELKPTGSWVRLRGDRGYNDGFCVLETPESLIAKLGDVEILKDADDATACTLDQIETVPKPEPKPQRTKPAKPARNRGASRASKPAAKPKPPRSRKAAKAATSPSEAPTQLASMF